MKSKKYIEIHRVAKNLTERRLWLFNGGVGTSGQLSRVIYQHQRGIKTMAKKASPGIFCLETVTWDNDLISGRQNSYESLLRFLNISLWDRVPFRHYGVPTKGALEFYLDRWKKELQEEYPILLLAFHGDKGHIDIFEDDDVVFTEEIARLLHSETSNNSFIHFSSCFLDKPSKMEELLFKTRALSVSCYRNKKGVDWHASAAFELLFLTRLFTYCWKESDEDFDDIRPPSDSSSMRKFATSPDYPANKAMLSLGRKLGFHLWYCVKGKGNPGAQKHPSNVRAVPWKELEKYKDSDS